MAQSTENLASEIEATFYLTLNQFVKNNASAELTCFDLETHLELKKLHNAISRVWNVISDGHYIPSGYRWKFHNRERPDINVQSILRAKKVEIAPLLEEFRHALNEFDHLSKTSPRFPGATSSGWTRPTKTEPDDAVEQ